MLRSCFEGTVKLAGVVPFNSPLTVTLAPDGSDTTVTLSVVPFSMVAQLAEITTTDDRAQRARLFIIPPYRRELGNTYYHTLIF